MNARSLIVIASLALVAAACSSTPDEGVSVEVVAEGLLAPIGLAELDDGSLLIAEDGTGEDDLSAGVSLLTADGDLRRVIDGFPSGRDAGDLAGVAMVGVSGSTVFVGNFGAGRLWTTSVDRLLAATSPLTPDDLDVAMAPLNNVQLTNPFDITFADGGRPVVSDASGNGLATQNDDGTTRFFHRFDELRAPDDDALRIEAVPTGIERVGGEYYVTLTGGCPYPAGSGVLVAVDEDRNQRTVVDGLDMPIDVAMGSDGAIWLLEFAEFDAGASCFTGSGYRAGTGRLSTVAADGTIDVIVDGLDHPGAVLPSFDGSVYVSKVFSGEVIRITLDGLQAAPTSVVPAAPAQLVDVAAERGLDFVHGAFSLGVSEDPVAAMGGGLCWLDADGDGWLDLYLVNSHSLDEASSHSDGLPASALYRNTEGSFSDVSAAAGVDLRIRGNGCVAADFDGDGDADIFVTADGDNALLLNQGDMTFRETAAVAGVDAPEWNTAAAVADVDGDGLLDLFVASYIDLAVTVPKPVGAFPQDYEGLVDRLYLNRGVGADGVPRFEEVGARWGLERTDRGLGAVFSDVDLDGDPDLYVANDGNPNRLYLNQGGRFEDVTDRADVGDSGSGMGIAAGDYDLDGLPDLFVTNWDRELHALYRSREEMVEPRFDYSTFRIGIAGLGNGQTGWGTSWIDIDHDTDLDLAVVHGRVPVADLVADAELARLYRNRAAEGEVGRFRDATDELGLRNLGPRSARGSAAADFDNDGDIDLAVNVIGGPALLLENTLLPGRDDAGWLSLVVDPPLPGVVAEVVLSDGSRLVRELAVGGSYLASEDPRLHFGLGGDRRVDVSVRWPDGAITVLDGIAADQRITVAPPG